MTQDTTDRVAAKIAETFEIPLDAISKWDLRAGRNGISHLTFKVSVELGSVEVDDLLGRSPR